MPLLPPLLDADGKVVPHDHNGIASTDAVIRRISERQLVIDKTGQLRISSIAFNMSSGQNEGMSVDLEAQILEAGLDPKRHVTTPRWLGSVRLPVGDLRQLNLIIGFDPLPDNPYHGQVWGKLSKSKQRAVQALAVWFVKIENALIA